MLSSIFLALPDSDLRTISPSDIITGIAFSSESASAMDDIVIFSSMAFSNSLEIRPVYHRKKERIEAHVFVHVLSLLIAWLFEKAVNEKYTISVISDMLSELKAIPVRTSGGIITLRSESENARNILNILKIPYPGRIINSVLTDQ